MSKRSRSKANIPIHREFLSCLLPYPPILPSLPRAHRHRPSILINGLFLCVLCDLCGLIPFLQNKANFKMGNINISTARTKTYAKEQRKMSNEHYPKQTQFKPNPSPKLELCSTLSEVEGPIKPNFKRTNSLPSLPHERLPGVFLSLYSGAGAGYLPIRLRSGRAFRRYDKANRSV